jgi:hypothetical protein
MRARHCCYSGTDFVCCSMLVVMTFNAGLFIAIILGVIVGELVLGRFTGNAAYEEGSCHD